MLGCLKLGYFGLLLVVLVYVALVCVRLCKVGLDFKVPPARGSNSEMGSLAGLALGIGRKALRRWTCTRPVKFAGRAPCLDRQPASPLSDRGTGLC